MKANILKKILLCAFRSSQIDNHSIVPHIISMSMCYLLLKMPHEHGVRSYLKHRQILQSPLELSYLAT
mgnify:CR=1 FL=1